MSEQRYTSCAFLPCHEVAVCCLVGGCVRVRFPNGASVTHEAQLPASKALNGTKPRPVRDPTFIKRRRRALR